MTGIDIGSFDSHKNCTPGDSVIAKDENGKEYRGTVIDTPGATVRVQSNDGKMLEFRRVKDNDTGERAILLAIDGKGVTDHGSETGVNSEGQKITKESYTLSFDYQITHFESEHQQHTIG